MKTWRRALTVVLGLAIAAAIGLALAPAKLHVEVGRVEPTPLKVKLEATGKAQVRLRHVVAAPVSGQLARIVLRPGDQVGAGDELARVAPVAPPLLDARTQAELRARIAAARVAEAESRTAVERARLAHGLAQRIFERERLLAEDKSIPAQKIETTEFELRARAKELHAAELGSQRAQREVEALRATLLASSPAMTREGAHDRQAGRHAERTVAVLAPAGGRVLRLLREHEGPVLAGTPLLELGDPRDLEVVVDLLTTQAVRVRVGAAVDIERWGGEQALHGKVRRIEPSAFTKVSALGVEEQRVNVLVDPYPAAAAWSALGDGYHLEAHILVWESPRTLTAPAGALFRQGMQWAAFVVERGRVRLRTVEVGESDRERIEIRGGLFAGEQVVIHPGDLLKDGAGVSVE